MGVCVILCAPAFSLISIHAFVVICVLCCDLFPVVREARGLLSNHVVGSGSVDTLPATLPESGAEESVERAARNLQRRGQRKGTAQSWRLPVSQFPAQPQWTTWTNCTP